MSKYYREVPEREVHSPRENIYCFGGRYFEKIEADEWHLASEPPTPEDFEPTGCIDILYHGGSSETTNTGGWEVRKLLNLKFHKDKITHWRRISPPK